MANCCAITAVGRKLNLTDRSYLTGALACRMRRDGGGRVRPFDWPCRAADRHASARRENGAIDFVLLASFNLQEFVEGFDDQLERAQILLCREG